MNFDAHEGPNGWPTESHVDDYVLNRLAPEARQELERHVAGCAECRTRVTQARLETAKIMSFLNGYTATVSDPCPSEETLACFMDRALVDDELKSIQHHLADCTRCLATMGRLHQTIRQLDEPSVAQDFGVELSSREPIAIPISESVIRADRAKISVISATIIVAVLLAPAFNSILASAWIAALQLLAGMLCGRLILERLGGSTSESTPRASLARSASNLLAWLAWGALFVWPLGQTAWTIACAFFYGLGLALKYRDDRAVEQVSASPKSDTEIADEAVRRAQGS